MKGAAAILMGVLCVLFSNTLHNEFAFDDHLSIVRNPDANGDRQWSEMWRHDFWGQPIADEGSHKSYRPITVLTFRLNTLFHQFFRDSSWYTDFCVYPEFDHGSAAPPLPELRPEFFHVINILLHGVVTLLVGQLARQLFQYISDCDEEMVLPAWVMSTFLFLIHPVHVEAITGLVGRAELLCAVFLLTGLLVWMKLVFESSPGPTGSSYFSRRTIGVYATCIVLFVLAVLSKETGFVLPILMVTLQWLWGLSSIRDTVVLWKRKDRTQLGISIVVCGCVCALYLMFRRWMVVHDAIPVNRQLENPIAFMEAGPLRWLSTGYIHWRYFRLLLWPYPLSCDYSLNCIPMISSFTDMRSIGTLLLYLTMAVSLAWGMWNVQKAEKKVFLMAWAIIFWTFLPASNVFVFVGTLIGERLLYLPSIGFCLLFGMAWSYLHQYVPRGKALFYVLLGAWLLWQCTITYQRNQVWANEEVLFLEAEKVCGESAKVQENLGIVDNRHLRFHQSHERFKRAREIWPNFCDVDMWRAKSLVGLEQYEEALQVASGCIDCRFSMTQCYELAQSLTAGLKQMYPLDPIRWSYLALKASEVEETNPLFAAVSFSQNRDAAMAFANAAIQHHDYTSAKKLQRALEHFNRAYVSSLNLGGQISPAVRCELLQNRARVTEQVATDKYTIARAWAEASQCDDTMEAAVRVLEYQKQDAYDAELHQIWAYAIAPYKAYEAKVHYEACAMLHLQGGDKDKAQQCVLQARLLERQLHEETHPK